MKKISFKYFLVLFLVFPEVIYGQSKITITRPRLEASDDKLVIEYDILNTDPMDFFIVWIEVTDAEGNKINAVSLSGDVGQEIKGGNNKRIIWNIGRDSIYIDKEIYVEVKAEKFAAQEKITDTQTSPETITKRDESNVSKKTISKSKMILSSVVMPGLGQTIASKGKPYWLLGVAGYGCLGGSIVLNRLAASSYDDYKLSMDAGESDDLFYKAVLQDKLSKYMFYSGVSIWVADLVWVLATPAKSGKSITSRENSRLKITPGFDPCSNSTTISLTYEF